MKLVIKFKHKLKDGALLITMEEGRLNRKNLENAIEQIGNKTGLVPDRILARFKEGTWNYVKYHDGRVWDIMNLFRTHEEDILRGK